MHLSCQQMPYSQSVFKNTWNMHYHQFSHMTLLKRNLFTCKKIQMSTIINNKLKYKSNIKLHKLCSTHVHAPGNCQFDRRG